MFLATWSIESYKLLQLLRFESGYFSFKVFFQTSGIFKQSISSEMLEGLPGWVILLLYCASDIGVNDSGCTTSCISCVSISGGCGGHSIDGRPSAWISLLTTSITWLSGGILNIVYHFFRRLKRNSLRIQNKQN